MEAAGSHHHAGTGTVRAFQIQLRLLDQLLDQHPTMRVGKEESRSQFNRSICVNCMNEEMAKGALDENTERQQSKLYKLRRTSSIIKRMGESSGA